jgi:hypothetical protein
LIGEQKCRRYIGAGKSGCRTHGGQFLPFSKQEKQFMRHEKAWAMARLTIDKIMRLPDMAY